MIKCVQRLPRPGLLAIAILLLAGPQRPSASADARVLTNLEFCLDVSGSMMAPFGDGKRADKALEAIIEFTSYRKGDAFGLTAFGTRGAALGAADEGSLRVAPSRAISSPGQNADATWAARASATRCVRCKRFSPRDRKAIA